MKIKFSKTLHITKVITLLFITIFSTYIAEATPISIKRIDTIDLNASAFPEGQINREDFDAAIDESGHVDIVWMRKKGKRTSENYTAPDFVPDHECEVPGLPPVRKKYEAYYSRGSLNIENWTTPLKIPGIDRPTAKIVSSKDSIYVITYEGNQISQLKSIDAGVTWRQAIKIDAPGTISKLLEPFIYNDTVNVVFLAGQKPAQWLLATWLSDQQTKTKVLDDTFGEYPNCEAAAQTINNDTLHLAHWYMTSEQIPEKGKELGTNLFHYCRYLTYALAQNDNPRAVTISRIRHTGTQSVSYADLFVCGGEVGLLSYNYPSKTVSLTHFPKSTPDKQQYTKLEHIGNSLMGLKAVPVNSKHYRIFWLTDEYAKRSSRYHRGLSPRESLDALEGCHMPPFLAVVLVPPLVLGQMLPYKYPYTNDIMTCEFNGVHDGKGIRKERITPTNLLCKAPIVRTHGGSIYLFCRAHSADENQFLPGQLYAVCFSADSINKQ